MSSFGNQRVISSASRRPAAAAAAFLGAALLASPLALAQTASGGSTTHHSRAVQAEETVDQRIATLHQELQITPDEENDWKAVAQTMRDNAAAMAKMAEAKSSESSQGMTAVQDLQTYAAFAQAHLDHLKALTASFETLYDAMPASQKKIADSVFERSHRKETSTAG
jgi:hypothetical protein